MKVSDEVVRVLFQVLDDPHNQWHTREERGRAALAAALPLVLGEPVAWQRRYGNGRHVFANGSHWSEWHEWVEDERPAMSGQWTNEYRQVYAPKEQQP